MSTILHFVRVDKLYIHTLRICRLAAEFPLLKHDLTEIRKQALMKLLRSNDEYDDDLVEQSIQVTSILTEFSYYLQYTSDCVHYLFAVIYQEQESSRSVSVCGHITVFGVAAQSRRTCGCGDERYSELDTVARTERIFGPEFVRG